MLSTLDGTNRCVAIVNSHSRLTAHGAAICNVVSQRAMV